MSLTNIEQVMPVKLTQALVDPLFPALDSALCSGHHIDPDELDSHALLMDFQEYLEEFYSRYNMELIRAPGGFSYLRPHLTTFIPHSILSELDMMVGKVPRYLYSSPEHLANEGVSTQQELYNELLMLADETKSLKLMNSHSTGSDVDRQRLQEEVRFSFNRLRRLGMVWSLSHDNSKFRITEPVLRFGVGVRSGDDPYEAQRRLIRDGGAMAVRNRLQLNDEPEENQPDSGEEGQ